MLAMSSVEVLLELEEIIGEAEGFSHHYIVNLFDFEWEVAALVSTAQPGPQDGGPLPARVVSWRELLPAAARTGSCIVAAGRTVSGGHSREAGMGDISTATWTTHVHGEATRLPATIDGIRAALPDSQHPAFDLEIGRTPAEDLHLVLVRWSLSTTEAADEDSDVIARLRRGEQVGRPVDPEAGVA
ncbi:hypothetical protein ACWC98_32980 [Streptomyces goshikiensis]